MGVLETEKQKTSLLELQDVQVVYDGVIVALRGVSLQVPHGAIVALLGANGAGKSTALKAASGLLTAEGGQVVGGKVLWQQKDICHFRTDHLVAQGVAQVLEGRHVFSHLTVEENLKLGAFIREPSVVVLKHSLEQIYHRFPRLRERRHSLAGYASGGEQQMLAIGRALMANPRLILLDEPSMGLAPIVVQEIFDGIQQLNQQDGVSFLLAEQNASIALQYAHYGYVLETGTVVTEGSAETLRTKGDVQRFYLGEGNRDRLPFIDPHRIRSFHAQTA